MKLRTAYVLAAVCLLLLGAGSAYAADVTVDCSNPKAKIKTINAALATLSKAGPNTIHVSGTCNEAVVIDGFDNLTLVANPGASINDPTPSITDDNEVVAVTKSRGVTVDGFTINQGIDGVVCAIYSICYLRNNTVQNASDAAVFIGRGSTADLTNNIIQNSAGGVTAFLGAQANVFGGMIQGNLGAGADASDHSLIRLAADGTTPVTVQDNGVGSEPAVFATDNSTVVLQGATITSNQSDGVGIFDGSVLRVGGAAQITGNGTVWPGSTGIRVGDSSSAFIRNGANVSSNPAPSQVICDGVFSRARGDGGNAGLTCQNP